jgi:hypothetical protein
MCAAYGAADRASLTVRRDIAVEVKIGVQHAPREVVLETNESVADIEKQVADAVKNSGTLAIDDVRGRKILVPGDKIAYVEIGGGVAGQVGFRS